MLDIRSDLRDCDRARAPQPGCPPIVLRGLLRRSIVWESVGVAAPEVASNTAGAGNALLPSERSLDSFRDLHVARNALDHRAFRALRGTGIEDRPFSLRS